MTPMDADFLHDHESELLREHARQRDLIVKLAHMRTPALTTGHLLEQMLRDEALEQLRARWHAAPDPRDTGDPASSGH